MKLFKRLYQTPSAYRGQPWEHVANQVLHAYLIGGVGWWGLSHAVPGVLAAGIWLWSYAMWERGQRVDFDADLSDGIEDWLHVASGVCVVAAATQGHLDVAVSAGLLHAGWLIYGWQWRREERDAATAQLD